MSYSNRSVYEFFDHHLVYDCYVTTSFAETYELYLDFCKKQQDSPVSKILFSRLLFQHDFAPPGNPSPFLCEKRMKNKGVFIENIRLSKVGKSFEDFPKNPFFGVKEEDKYCPFSEHEMERERGLLSQPIALLKESFCRVFPELCPDLISEFVEVQLSGILRLLVRVKGVR